MGPQSGVLSDGGCRSFVLADLFATVYKAFGIDWTKSYPSPIGRPIYIANSSLADTQGEPIKELV